MKDNKDEKIKISMWEEKYQRILDDIITKAPLECGVQTLVYMFLYEFISNEEVTVLVADLRKGEEKIFGGKGGVVDLCVVDSDFHYVKTPLDEKKIKDLEYKSIVRKFKEYGWWNEEKKRCHGLRDESLRESRREALLNKNLSLKEKYKEEKEKRRGCVEVKASNIELPEKIGQLVGHIQEYKKVIYTNGFIWMYFDIGSEHINIEENLFEKYLTPMSIERSFIEEEVMKQLKEKIGLQWIVPIISSSTGVLLTSMNAMGKENVKVDSEKFKTLVDLLSNITWKN